jgi:hypothetical protein
MNIDGTTSISRRDYFTAKMLGILLLNAKDRVNIGDMVDLAILHADTIIERLDKTNPTSAELSKTLRVGNRGRGLETTKART